MTPLVQGADNTCMTADYYCNLVSILQDIAVRSCAVRMRKSKLPYDDLKEKVNAL